MPRYWNNGVFTVTAKVKGKLKLYKVFKAGALGIRRHRKVKADANPYMPEYRKYFWIRRQHKESTLLQGLSARQIRMAEA